MAPSPTCLLPTLDDTARLAARICDLARPGDVILLEGPLGAGKSAFARAFLRHGAGDPALEVPSPTFTLVQSYELPRFRAHHFDLWRLDAPGAVLELGWDEMADDVALVEWPDRLGTLAPDDALTVALAVGPDEARRATLRGWPDRVGVLLPAGVAA